MDYTDMADHYDLIMTSGYYDYEAIVDHLARFDAAGSVLEVGVGTGLVLERLATRRPGLEMAGIDLTEAMLVIAAGRLGSRPGVTLHRQNVVTLSLERSYDLAFSYGGVWYFVPAEGGAGYSMVSHIRDPEENRQGFERLAAHVPTGGVVLLGVQAGHVDYTRPVANGMCYSQRIAPLPGGFRKHYALADGTRTVMEQTTDYRTFSFDDALELLDKCGLEYRDRDGARDDDHAAGAPLFLEFGKR